MEDIKDEDSGQGEDDNAGTLSFWDHLQELANSLKIVIYTFIISAVLLVALPGDLSFLSDFGNYQFLIAVLLRLIRNNVLSPDVKLVGLALTDPMQLYLTASLLIAAAITFPVLALQVYRFITPALYPNEKKAVYPFFASFSVLFLFGLFFGYLIVTPYMIRAMLVFYSAIGAEMFIDIMSFYTLLLETTLLMGFVFTFPVFFVLLVKFGIINTKIVTKNRKYVYAGLLILTFAITPDGGFAGNALLFAPLMILLEGAVLFSKRYEKENVTPRFRLFRTRLECKFCGAEMPSNTEFCQQCGRSRK